MIDNDEIIREFIAESNENLERMDKEFLALEDAPNNTEVLASIFRAIHTIKGTCGFFGFHQLESVSHAGESLLCQLRDGVLVLTPAMTTALLRLVDALREILQNIESSGSEGESDHRDLIAILESLQTTPNAGASDGLADAVNLDVQQASTDPSSDISGAPVLQEDAVASLDSRSPRLGNVLIAMESTTSEGVKAALQRQNMGDRRPIGEILVDGGSCTATNVADALEVQSATCRVNKLSECSVRVDIGLLDRLMNMVGELVLARNRTLQCTVGIEDSNLNAATQRLNLITTELQDAVMKTRMQPIGNAWSKLPRVVRDLSATLGKKIRLEMEGQDTELDRTILEAIKDPLTHIVRNSIDHGIEMPSARAAEGKPEEGFLALKSYHEGGQVIIEITDDGGGINTERVSHKALERNLISRDQLSKMSEREVMNLIFLPGFSTAEQVTNISGRGVGMDVVKTNIEKIGGSIDLQSARGRGTTLKIRIPLTLAIVPALMVKCRGESFAIPQVSLLELVRIDAEQRKSCIESIHDSSVFRLRGDLLPLVYLDKLLRLDIGARDNDEESLNIVVLQTENRPFGLVVEAIQDTEEIVVKPLGKQLQHLGIFAGAAVRGDGRVALVLDVAGTARVAEVAGTVDRRAGREAFNGPAVKANTRSVLVFRAGENGRYAVPLSQIARLEEFDEAKAERVGKQLVIQYRGQILPLVHVDGASRFAKPDESRRLQVVVCGNSNRSLGLVVDQILDIADAPVQATSAGVRGQVPPMEVIQGCVTEFFDVDALLCVGADMQSGDVHE